MTNSPFVADSYYTWAFVTDTGDVYGGHTYEDTGTFFPGQVIDTTYGYYYIGDEVQYGYDLESYYGILEGSTFVTYYLDKNQGALATWNASQGGASTFTGIGTEYDWAAVGTGMWDDFGAAGYYQAGFFG